MSRKIGRLGQGYGNRQSLLRRRSFGQLRIKIERDVERRLPPQTRELIDRPVVAGGAEVGTGNQLRANIFRHHACKQSLNGHGVQQLRHHRLAVDFVTVGRENGLPVRSEDFQCVGERRLHARIERLLRRQQRQARRLCGRHIARHDDALQAHARMLILHEPSQERQRVVVVRQPETRDATSARAGIELLRCQQAFQ